MIIRSRSSSAYKHTTIWHYKKSNYYFYDEVYSPCQAIAAVQYIQYTKIIKEKVSKNLW